ncbi:uncharacterized protein LOC115246299 [Formica exsecta]|uniref:uncharacterized protein LOC115246299 n=1 Tax=Formica exsecta TaxID=72781 RepID=UPI0011429DF0|nr:uncharacterized protein LOC115246299 [Formica exsecta]
MDTDMDKENEDPQFEAALSSLISEARSTSFTNKKDRGKRSGGQEVHPPAVKTFTGSVITLTDNIRNNRYSDGNAGPFDVHVQRKSDPGAPLHPISVGRIICGLNIQDILEIKRIGLSKVLVFFKSGSAANSLVQDQRLAAKNLEAFIPPFRTSRKAIIKDVPLHLTDQMILDIISSPIKVVAVNRLNRRISRPFVNNSQEHVNSSSNYTPSLTVLLTFEGQKIPKHVTMFHVRYPVSPYISKVSRCNQCFRFGHIKINCKGQPRCVHCGEKGHIFSKESCQLSEAPPKCANCQGCHRADSPTCPEFTIQKEIRKFAAYRNVLLLDAREIFKAHSYNYIIYAIKQKLHQIKTAGFEITIVWIPAHMGILGNETADYLAKKAIIKGQLSPKQLPHSDFYSIPRRKYIEDSSKFLKFQARQKGAKYFNSFEEIILKPWFHKLKLNRESIVTCCRIRSDHYALNHSLHRCNLVADPSCPCGAPRQDVDHVFWGCPRFNGPRTTLLSQLWKYGKIPALKTQEILKNPSSGVIHAVHAFLKSSNLNI